MKAIVLLSIVGAFGALSSGCLTVALAPGADKVRLTSNAADVTACKAVGNVKRPQGINALDVEPSFRNQAVGLGGNTVFVTRHDLSGPLEGIAYQCP